MKKLAIQTNQKQDEYYTPKIIVKPLLLYIPTSYIIWESAWGKGSLAKHFTEEGYKVVGDPKINFLTDYVESDIIITNPPYSKKYEFLKRAYELNKPFAFLLPLTTLEGKKRGELYRKYGISLIIPNKRINFIMPSGKGSGAWFQVAWFCWKIYLPNQLNFVEL